MTDETEDHWSHWGLDDEEIAEYSALHEDIPGHLETSLWSWVRDAVTVPAATYASAYSDSELVRQFERILQVPIKWPHNRTDVIWAIQQAYLDRPIRDIWRLVDWLLGHGHAHGGTLKQYLLQSGSAYTVEAADNGKSYLVKRVPEGVQDAATAAFRHANAGRRLAKAWEAAFGVEPDPTKAYAEAVKAVEDAAIPVVPTGKQEPTLGDVIRAIDGGTWRLPHLREHNLAPSHDVLVAMLRMLWRGHHDRHGGPSTVGVPAVTPEEAESAVILAVTLVGWFATGKVQQ